MRSYRPERVVGLVACHASGFAIRLGAVRRTGWPFLPKGVHRAKGHIRPVGSIEPRKIIDLNRLEQLEEAVKELEDAVAVLAQISDIDESVPFDAVIEQIAVLRRLGYPEDADRADPEPSPAPEQRASAD
jgi:hypothetical protein